MSTMSWTIPSLPTDAEIEALFKRKSDYQMGCLLLATPLILPIVILAYRIDLLRRQRYWRYYFPTPLCTIWQLCWILSFVTLYFPIPKFLTFGMEVGGFMPATCEASMAVEGWYGLPCLLKRAREWVGRWMTGDRGEALGEFEGWWMFYLIFWSLMVVLLLVMHFVVGPRQQREGEKIRCERKAAKRSDALDLEDVWKSERDVLDFEVFRLVGDEEAFVVEHIWSFGRESVPATLM